MTVAVNDVLGFAYDQAAGTFSIYQNNTLRGTISGLSTTDLHVPSTNPYNNTNVFEFNFGQRAFAYTAPSGFKALCTQNLPTPTIANGAQYFAATTYTGNTSTQVITNGGNNNALTTFAPDLVWLKVRNDAQNHRLFDTVRGANKRIMSSSTAVEATTTDELTAFNTNGFTLEIGRAHV